MDDLSTLDCINIRRITNISSNGYNFPVYGLNHNRKERTYVVKYAEEPLDVLKKMYKRIKTLDDERKVEDQVKLFYTRLNKILNNTKINDQFIELCFLVLIEAKKLNVFDNGGLVSCIMTKVREAETLDDKRDGIMRPSPSRKTSEAEDENFKEQRKSEPSVSDNNTKNLPGSSNAVAINPDENNPRYSRPQDNQGENSTIVYPDDQQANKLARDKEPKQGQLQRKYGRKQKLMLSNNEIESCSADAHDNSNGDEPTKDDDREGATSENSQISASREDVLNDSNNCPREEQDDGKPAENASPPYEVTGL